MSTIGVLGAGTMGHGIAYVCLVAGHDVTVRDVDADRVEAGIEAIESLLQSGVDRGVLSTSDADAAQDRLTGTTGLSSTVAGADVVIEAIPEDLALKQETFEAVEADAPPDALLASNTSSLSITEIANALENPDRFLGMHFFNPPYAMELVELVTGERTAEHTVDRAQHFVEDLDKTAITVRDTPGFATSRLGVALGVEAMRMVETGVASVPDIDQAMKLGYDHPMGPIELGDHVGLDVRLDILEHLYAELGERFRPPQILKRKVRAGRLGKKTGAGFYRWEDDEIVGVVDEVDRDG